jgi:hypothetical protein
MECFQNRPLFHVDLKKKERVNPEFFALFRRRKMNNTTFNCSYLNIAPNGLRSVPGLTKCGSSSLKGVQLQNILHCSATEEGQRHADCVSKPFHETARLVYAKRTTSCQILVKLIQVVYQLQQRFPEKLSGI